LAVASCAAAQKPRNGRNLANTFPFNQRGAAAHAHHHDDGHHHAEHHHHEDDSGRLARQRGRFGANSNSNSRQGAGEDVDLSIGNIAAAGERCIDKVVMVEETEYDEEITCQHSYSERCHTTYTTDFKATQEEECDENFKKSCFIEYKKVAFEEPIKFCHTPLICEGEGPEECKKVFESQCSTRYHEHEVEDDVVECETIQEEKCEDVTQGYTTEQRCTKWPVQKCNGPRTERVKKYTPETNCEKIERTLCGPSGCVPTPGPEECFDKKETVVQEVPEETCNLEP